MKFIPFLNEDDWCFACVDKGGAYKCICLDVTECPGYSCSSYKTKAQIKEQKEKCKKRIEEEIPVTLRKYIEAKYGRYR